jgi:type VI secretion system secreted protein Hcp
VASDYLLKLDGIKGESTDAAHKDEIEVESFTWGASNPGSFAVGGGGGSGKVNFTDISFSSRASVASPNLMLACASGQHIKSAILTVRKSGKEAQEYYQVKLSDVLVANYQTSGSNGSDAMPMDSFSLNFAKVEFAYKAQKPDGTLGAAVEGKWDLKQNKKV